MFHISKHHMTPPPKPPAEDVGDQVKLPAKPPSAIIAPPRLKGIQSQPGLELCATPPFHQQVRRAPSPPHHDLVRIGGYWLDYASRFSLQAGGERWSLGQGNLNDALSRLRLVSSSSSSSSSEPPSKDVEKDRQIDRALFYALFLLGFFPKVYATSKLQPALAWYHQLGRILAQRLFACPLQQPIHTQALEAMEWAAQETFQGRWDLDSCAWWIEEVPIAVEKEEQREQILSDQERHNRWRVGIWKVGWVWAESASEWIANKEEEGCIKKT